MAFIVEQAGGIASDRFNRILDIVPGKLHQMVSIFIGSEKMLRMGEAMMQEFSPETNAKLRSQSPVEDKLQQLNVIGWID
jgi:fructose-1,6-bisphosphatase I